MGSSYRIDYPSIYLSGMVSDDTAVQSVTWSNDRGGSGDASLGTAGEWSISQVALQPGANVITLTSFDTSNNSTVLVVTIVRATSTGTLHVDCAAPASGDGSAADPLNSLRQAVDWASSGSSIQIDGGPCTDHVLVYKGLTIAGEPAKPRPVLANLSPSCPFPDFLDNSEATIQVVTRDLVVLEHLEFTTSPVQQFLAGQAYQVGPPVQVQLHDVANVFVSLASSDVEPGPSTLLIADSTGIDLSSRCCVFRGNVVVTRSSLTALNLSGEPGFVNLTLSDSEVLSHMNFGTEGSFHVDVQRSILRGGLDVAGARVWDANVAVRDSLIEGGRVRLAQGGWLGYMIDRAVVSLTGDVFRNTSISLDYSDIYTGGTAGFGEVSVTLENNRLESSPIDVSLYRSGAPPSMEPRNLRVRNNIASGGGFQLNLDQNLTSQDAPTYTWFVNNTVVGAPVGFGVTAVNSGSAMPIWPVFTENNAIIGGQTGLSFSGLLSFYHGIENNDVYGNSTANYAGELDDYTDLAGNISADPIFVDPQAGDFRLQASSPCIDAGLDGSDIPTTDYAGTPRPLDGNLDSVAVSDIGAFEFVPDADGDGSDLLADCDDANPYDWATPGEVRNLVFDDDARFEWDAPVPAGGVFVFYDSLRSPIATDFLGAAACIESNDALDARASDAAAPAPGSAFYYLVRAENSCPAGQGPLGFGSNGTPIVGRNCP